MEKSRVTKGTIQASMRGDDEFYSFEQWTGSEWVEYSPGTHFWSKRMADVFGENNFADYRK